MYAVLIFINLDVSIEAISVDKHSESLIKKTFLMFNLFLINYESTVPHYAKFTISTFPSLTYPGIEKIAVLMLLKICIFNFEKSSIKS